MFFSSSRKLNAPEITISNTLECADTSNICISISHGKVKLSCTDTSSVVSKARKFSIDTADNSNSECPELSELEESFLRAVSHNKISEVKRFLDEKVNINVQNGFKR